jgi:hypothetical protein
MVLEAFYSRKKSARVRCQDRQFGTFSRAVGPQAALAGVEGDPDAHGAVVAGDHLAAEQRRHQRGDPLLAVDEDPLAEGPGPVLELDVGVAPGDQVAYGESAQQGVQQVADVGGLPHERPLDLRYGDLAASDPCQQCVDMRLCDLMALSRHLGALAS